MHKALIGAGLVVAVVFGLPAYQQHQTDKAAAAEIRKAARAAQQAASQVRDQQRKDARRKRLATLRAAMYRDQTEAAERDYLAALLQDTDGPMVDMVAELVERLQQDQGDPPEQDGPAEGVRY